MVQYYTNRKAVAQVRELIGDATGKISDETAWSSRLILDRLYSIRAQLLQQKHLANLEINQFNLQIIPCIPLEKADTHECPCAPPTGCVWRRTKYPIPSFIKMVSMSSIDGSINYDFVAWNRVSHKLNSFEETDRRRPYYTFKSTQGGIYAYLINDEHKKYVTPTGIFEDPIQVQLYPDCKGNVDPCPLILDLDFIVDPDLREDVYNQTILKLKQGRSNSTVDVVGDDREDFTKAGR